MSGLITLYKNAALTQELSDGSWVQSMLLPTTTLPGTGSTTTSGVAGYALNEGTTTMLDVYIQPVSGGGLNGTSFSNNIQIAQDSLGTPGTPGTYGSSGANVLVYSGQFAPAVAEPASNTSSPAVTNPSTAPTLAAIGTTTLAALGSTSTFAAGTYTVAYSYTNAGGETLVSSSGAIVLSAGQGIRVNQITLGTNATGINYYVSPIANRTEIYKSGTGTGGSATLLGVTGFLRFWARQVVDYTDPTGVYQAQLTVSAIDIG